MYKLSTIAAVASVVLSSAMPQPAAAEDSTTYRDWIAQMKQAPRGPFSGVLWFCADGAVLPPRPFACEPHGGGVQHGQWTERTLAIRDAGYPVANILARLEPGQVVGRDADPGLLGALLIERFLISYDDGWILRRAHFLRGVMQEHNESDSGRAILLAMLDDPGARENFLLLRESVRWLPHSLPTPLLTRVRGLAGNIAGRDPAFDALRASIHAMPEAADAARVRAYAAGPDGRQSLQADYTRLARDIDAAYAEPALDGVLRRLGSETRDAELKRELAELAAALDGALETQSRLRLAAASLALIRDRFQAFGPAASRLAALDASHHAALAAFTASRNLLQELPQASRARRLQWLKLAAQAIYGMGLLSEREWAEISDSVNRLSGDSVALATYRGELRALERAAGWPGRRLQHAFGDSVALFGEIEPLADEFIADRLRGSPLLFYSDVLDSLARDADRHSHTPHRMFGESLSTGLRGLNPGIARGVLHTAADLESAAPAGERAIYLVPETVATLPAAAGILTAAEGNPLSHVQLLARNLGIPNVVVAADLLPALEARRGQRIVVAASAGGVVHIDIDGPDWDRVFDGEPVVARQRINVDLSRLDTRNTELVATHELRRDDSGRSVGPKAAGVGELAHHYPRHVSPGLVIPFGVFRAVLDRPRTPGGASMFDWMVDEYARLAVRRGLDPAGHAREVTAFLASVRQWLQAQEFDPALRERLRHAMFDTFGMPGTYGVFVRSDTNVEDLPGFTGAGLNETVPNVVAFDAVIAAIQRVWASPFSERAYAWRQDLMDRPEHVYASVLLHRTVAVDKSGVMVTADLDSGARTAITVATNLGAMGGVDGQAAETLRINLDDGETRLLASATARIQRRLPAAGGIAQQPAEAPEAVLTEAEIAALADFARALPATYPPLLDADGEPVPADVEFGFVGGRLMLFQIRPFLDSAAARHNRYLTEMDAGSRQYADLRIDLGRIPQARP